MSTPEVGNYQPDSVSSTSIGEATITTGETEIVVETTAFTDESKILSLIGGW